AVVEVRAQAVALVLGVWRRLRGGSGGAGPLLVRNPAALVLAHLLASRFRQTADSSRIGNRQRIVERRQLLVVATGVLIGRRGLAAVEARSAGWQHRQRRQQDSREPERGDNTGDH